MAINRIPHNILLLLALILMAAQVAVADEIRLESGDYLTGTVERIDAGQAVITTSYAGEIVVPSGAIVALSTEEPVTVIFNDGDYLTGRIRPTDGATCG